MIDLVLASASRSRADILRGAGISFRVVSPGVDEAPIKARMLADGARPPAIASALAEAKALAAPVPPGALVIGADQTLDLDGELFDKAPDLDALRDQLRRLRGRRHVLHAATSIARDGAVVWRGLDAVTLTMRAFSDAFLDHYLAREGEAVLGNVGGYRLEGFGAQLFDRVEGDYFTVLGLPLWDLLAFLRGAGVLTA